MSRRVFLGTEAVVYAAFLLLDVTGASAGVSAGLKYAGVLLCLAFALSRLRRGYLHSALTAAALAFTVVADLFLLVLDRWYLAGVLVFWVVQGLWLTRIRLAGGWPLPRCLAVRLGLPAAALAVLYALNALLPLNIAAAIYFSQLLANAAESRTLIPARTWGRTLHLGLVLFIGCDVCVGLHNVTAAAGLALPLWLGQAAALGMWLFYLPSQVLLALSGCEEVPLS